MIERDPVEVTSERFGGPSRHLEYAVGHNGPPQVESGAIPTWVREAVSAPLHSSLLSSAVSLHISRGAEGWLVIATTFPEQTAAYVWRAQDLGEARDRAAALHRAMIAAHQVEIGHIAAATA